MEHRFDAFLQIAVMVALAGAGVTYFRYSTHYRPIRRQRDRERAEQERMPGDRS